MPSEVRDDDAGMLWGLLFVVVISISFLFIGSQSSIVGETPCVDGNNRVNLEGIMCEDIESTWFGLNHWWQFLSLTPLILYSIFIKRRVDR